MIGVSEQPTEAPPARSRLASLAPIAVFDIAGPLVLYMVLRNNGVGEVTALVASGAFPAFGVIYGVLRNHRIDSLGVLILAGIALGSILGLASGNPRTALVDSIVPSFAFAAFCLLSLATSKPLMFRFAVEFMGPDTARGREFADRWRYAEFRRVFRTMTAVFGVGLLFVTALNVLIAEAVSPISTARVLTNIVPYVMVGALVAWMTAYGMRQKRKGEARSAAAQAAERRAPFPAN